MGKILRNGWGRLQLAAIEYRYKEMDRQLKEQFIHGLNDTDMLTEIIWELTKINENETKITSEIVLSWAKRVEAQRSWSAIMNSLTEAKEFDKQKIGNNIYKDSTRRSTQTEMLAKHMCRYCGSSHPPRWCPAYGKKCTECNKNVKARAMNEVEQEAAQDSAEEISLTQWR